MSGLKRFFLIAAAILLQCICMERSYAQDLNDSTYLASIQDSIDRYIEKHPHRFKPDENRLKVLPLFGANYSKENGLGFLTGAFGQYRNGISLETPLSSIAAMAYISTKKTIIGAALWKHTFKGGKMTFDWKIRSFYLSRSFWGLGYLNNDNDENLSQYSENGITTDAALLFNLSDNWIIGPKIGFNYRSTFDFSNPLLISDNPLFTRALRVGVKFEYDSRDDKFSPSEGALVQGEQAIFLSNNSKPYYNSVIIADYFIPLWSKCVLALDLYSEFNYGDSPWIMWSVVGGDTRMRGYYPGRYRDKNMIATQLELRQNIAKGHGVILWGGAGIIFPSFDSIKLNQTLPTYGVGYRFSFFNYILRLDFGMGKWKQYALTMGINHAF